MNFEKHNHGKNLAILHFAAPPIVGGVESTIYHHALLLMEAGYKVDVIAGRGDNFSRGVNFMPIPEVDSRHPQVLEIGQELAEGGVTNRFEILRDRLVEKLSAALAPSQNCIVHNALTLHKNLPLTAALKILNDQGRIRILAWCHDFAWLDPLYTPQLHPGYPWDLLRQAWQGVKYVAVSNYRRDLLAELLGIQPQTISVVTPGVDAFSFLSLDSRVQKLVRKLDLLQAAPLLLLPARITRRKNIQFAIRLVAELKKMAPQVALVITGPPGAHNPKNLAYLESLKSLCDELQVHENVHFLYEQGQHDQPLYLPDESIAGLFRLADLLLFPSKREGFGIPVLEAGLARLPVFASDIPPVWESAGELANTFDPNGDPQEIARGMYTFLESDRAYHLKRRIVERFTWRSILKKQVIPMIEEGVPT
ncbi:MAG: glycosyltransferase [Anaerolineales bacterium]|jgi:glycosyltransferase involved in cell wall biosynthesis